jgi:hypothetical protein
MHKHQWLEELELPDCKVCTPCRLLALFSKNTNTHMGLCDHIDVISTVSNSKRYFVWESLSNKVNNISFLLRRNSTSQNNINII